MDKYVINLPDELSIKTLQNYLKTDKSNNKSIYNYNIVTFDFRNCKNISPTGIVYIKMLRDRLNDNNIKTFYKAKNEITEYLKRFNLVPLNDEKDIKEKYKLELKSCNNTDECLEAHKYLIKNIIEPTISDKSTFSSIDYMLNELRDNAGVHGYKCYNTKNYPKPVYMCAFYNESVIEIAIGDLGQGIYKSLSSNNTDLIIKNEKEALISSLKLGVSGHPDKSPGFGLFCAKEFTEKANGSLHIWSSNTYLKFEDNVPKLYSSKFDIGTIIGIIIPIQAHIPFEEVISNYLSYDRTADDYLEEIGVVFDEG